MKSHPTLLVLIFTIMLMTSCSPKNKLPVFQEKNIVFSLSKGSCLGKCAVYTMSVYKNKHALYEGTANTDKLGKYYKVLPDSTYHKLEKHFKDIGFTNFDSMYPSDIMDFPSITIGYHVVKPIKYVTFKENKPESLAKLQVVLESVANSLEWVPMQKAKNDMEYKPISNPRDHSDGVFIKSEIIIQTKPEVIIEKWLQRYQGYGVNMVQKIAPNLTYYVISWNQDLISPEEMLTKCKQDNELQSAEFNKKIMVREH